MGEKKITKMAFAKKIAIFGVALVGLSLIISASVMLSKHSNEILERSTTEATNNGLVSRSEIESKIYDYVSYASQAAGSLTDASSTEDALNKLKTLDSAFRNTHVGSQLIGLNNIHFYNGELVYNTNDQIEPEEDDLAIVYRKNTDVSNQTATYLGSNYTKNSDYSEESSYKSYEFYAPVLNNNYVDGVSLYFEKVLLHSYFGDSFAHDNSVFSGVCRDNGRIVVGTNNTSFSKLSDQLLELGASNSDVDKVISLYENKKSGFVLMKINGVNNVCTISANEPVLKDLMVVELYECSKLAQSTTDLINAIVAVIVIFIVVIVLTIGFLVYNHFKLQKKVLNSENTDLKLQCLNRNGFVKEATQILSREHGLYYAVIVVHLRHYKYLNENYGEQEINSLLDYLKITYQKTCKIEETYGHAENGEFLMLLHAKDREDLIDRLKIHSFLAGQYKGANKFDVALKYGIYEHQTDEKSSVSKMIDYANEANNAIVKATVENVDMQFNFYNDDLRKIRLLNEDMELRQDSALKDGEFQIFYQAKYNLKTHKQDGAEALVRWYDAKTGEYNKPALFMPLFESNGFIEKLDKYVYTKVCEYISYSLSSGRNVFPVSVNVSRITATQSDFVDFYARTKKKYGIANGAITIEFTESFAYENYDVLKSIVKRLHDAGFKTSIDDFGCGYSSYRILKELPMDEIKLDKFFIDYSENPERINHIFESVIELAKKLNMKVTQEGVEKAEDVELLKKLGCDVIQGYIYSHPLSLTDYLAFVENTKDHNL